MLKLLDFCFVKVLEYFHILAYFLFDLCVGKKLLGVQPSGETIKGLTRILWPGWYMVEVESGSELLAKLSFDGKRYEFKLTKPGVSKRVLKVDSKAKISIVFGSESHSELTSFYSIKIIPIFEFFAVNRMKKKIASNGFFIEEQDSNGVYSLYEKLLDSKSNSYLRWIEDNEKHLGEFSDTTCDIYISIVVPLFESNIALISQLYSSIRAQIYSNYELIFVDDASSDDLLKEFLLDLEKRGDKTRVFFKEKNTHISDCTNFGLERATGDYVVFLDHDDLLSEYALLEIVNTIEKKPAIRMIYSDEDLISKEGERVFPHFKPDWNPDLLYSHNYVTHLACYETNFLRSIGGCRVGYEGAQDYDLILRASRELDASQIVHIPKVLYHWRMVEGSTAASASAKSYATEAGLKALRDHMQHIDSNITVEHDKRDNYYKVNWSLPKDDNDKPLVSIIVPTKDGLDVLKPCIKGLINNTGYPNIEILIVDNGSEEKATHNYLNQIEKYPFIKVVRDDRPFNYSAINNRAVSLSRGDLVCLLNNDIEVIHDDWLSEMVSLAIRPEIGCVGAKLLYPDDTIQHAGVILGLGGYAAHSHRGFSRYAPGYFGRAQARQNVSAVTGACLLVRRDIYVEVGGLDEAFEVAYNDVDFCLRVQKLGYRNIYTPYAELYHHESKTRGSDESGIKKKRFDREKALLVQRWQDFIDHDPAYNPNLTKSREDFSLGSI